MPFCAALLWRAAPCCRRPPSFRCRPEPVTRYKLTIEYDGGPFAGWQRQDNGPSIQAALEDAIEKFCGEATTVAGAGRTDAGVHALGQVAHVDIAKSVIGDKLRDAVNAHLRPAPIAVLRAEEVSA